MSTTPVKVISSTSHQHVSIVSKNTFQAAKAAVEALIPELDTAEAGARFEQGNKAAAIKTLEAQPPLILFNTRPRHVGPLLKTLNRSSSVVQFEIGHPLSAIRITQHEAGLGLYFPMRVLLKQEDNVTTFEYDSIVSQAQPYGPQVTELAQDFEDRLERALLVAAGHE